MAKPMGIVRTLLKTQDTRVRQRPETVSRELQWCFGKLFSFNISFRWAYDLCFAILLPIDLSLAPFTFRIDDWLISYRWAGSGGNEHRRGKKTSAKKRETRELLSHRMSANWRFVIDWFHPITRLLGRFTGLWPPVYFHFCCFQLNWSIFSDEVWWYLLNRTVYSLSEIDVRLFGEF